MKKCPNCQKTFDDNMKFCQTDGTPLVVVADNKPEADPYATMVASKSDLPVPSEEPKDEPKEEADPYATVVGGSSYTPKEEEAVDDDDILNVFDDDEADQADDPMKTMIVSGNTADNFKVDIPEEKPAAPKAESEAETILSPGIPKFNEPEISPPNLDDSDSTAKADDISAKPEAKPEMPDSPFAADKADDSKPAPIPSPFDSSMPPGYAPPSTPPFEPPKEPLKPEPLNVEKKEESPKSPFDQPNKPVFEEPKKPAFEAKEQNWNPPQAPEMPSANAGKQGIANQSFDNNAINNNASGTDGQNQTFAIVSLVSGILSILCCFSVITGPLAIILGYMARNKAAESPNEFGGEKLALIGMILGGVGVILFVIVIILNFIGAFAGQF